MKLLCAGLPKTGTKTIAHALKILGYKVCDIDDQMLHYMDEWLDLYNHGKVPDFYSMFKDVDAVIDVPSSCFFEELVEAFPDAKVVLSVRDEDSWHRSYRNQARVMSEFYLTKIRRFLPTYNNFLEIVFKTRMAFIGDVDLKSSYICRKRFRWHNDRVRAVVPADKLLVFSVDQGWKPLCEFLGKKIPDQPFPHLNIKAHAFTSLLDGTEFGRKLTKEANIVMLCFVGVAALVSVLLAYCFGLC